MVKSLSFLAKGFTMAYHEVTIIEDSLTQEDSRITTFQLKYWRAFHGEFMTHRVFFSECK